MQKYYMFRDFGSDAIYLFENTNELNIFFKKYIELYVENGKYDLPQKYEDYNIEKIGVITGEDAIKDYLGIKNN